MFCSFFKPESFNSRGKEIQKTLSPGCQNGVVFFLLIQKSYIRGKITKISEAKNLKLEGKR